MYNGTSFAAPLVTAAVATALGQVDDLSIDEITFLLAATSDNYNENSTCLLEGKYCGSGGLNAKAFVEAAKKLKAGELSYIQHALIGAGECVSVIIKDHLQAQIPSCSLYELSFNSLAQEKAYITYSLYRFEKGSELSLDNPAVEVVIDHTTRPSHLIELNDTELADFDYAMRTCINGNCQPITPVRVSPDKPSQCD
jgi:hypothetical protein